MANKSKFFEQPDSSSPKPSDSLLNDAGLAPPSRRKPPAAVAPVSEPQDPASSQLDPDQEIERLLGAHRKQPSVIADRELGAPAAQPSSVQALVSPEMKKTVLRLAKDSDHTVSSWMNEWLRCLLEHVEADPTVIPDDLKKHGRGVKRRWPATIQIVMAGSVLSDLDALVLSEQLTSRSRFIRWGLVTFSEAFQIEPRPTNY